jgi:hypothetical protein
VIRRNGSKGEGKRERGGEGERGRYVGWVDAGNPTSLIQTGFALLNPITYEI